MKKYNVSAMYCVTRNDSFVNNAWEKASNATGTFTMLSDPLGDFLSKIELKVAIPIFGEDRYARFAAIIDNGKVEQLFVEPDGKGATCSLSSNLLK
jgi:peroxiredoxin